MTYHRFASGSELHMPDRVSDSDPGAIGAWKTWYNPDSRQLRRRNEDDDGWLDLVIVPEVRTEETDAYTLQLSDFGAHIRISDGTAATVTLPKDATLDLPIGFHVRIEQLDAGAVDIVPEETGPDVPDIRSIDGDDQTAGQYAVVELLKVGADEWVLTGDLTSSA